MIHGRQNSKHRAIVPLKNFEAKHSCDFFPLFLLALAVLVTLVFCTHQFHTKCSLNAIKQLNVSQSHFYRGQFST